MTGYVNTKGTSEATWVKKEANQIEWFFLLETRDFVEVLMKHVVSANYIKYN